MNINNGYEWSTHQPIIKAVMELYTPAFVLELGIGDNSTPVFLNYKTKLLGVESDKEWIDHIRNKYKNIDVIYHDLNEVKIFTHLKELSDDKKFEIFNYYHNLVIPELKPNLLFVDQFTACRTLSINALYDKFDLILYHDCQYAGIPFYDYNLINVNGFIKYFLKSPSSWTGLMVRTKIDKGYTALNMAILPYIIEYKNKNLINYMELTYIY